MQFAKAFYKAGHSHINCADFIHSTQICRFRRFCDQGIALTQKAVVVLFFVRARQDIHEGIRKQIKPLLFLLSQAAYRLSMRWPTLLPASAPITPPTTAQGIVPATAPTGPPTAMPIDAPFTAPAAKPATAPPRVETSSIIIRSSLNILSNLFPKTVRHELSLRTLPVSSVHRTPEGLL